MLQGNVRNHLRILVWNIHGGYLYNLSQIPHEFYVPYKREPASGYAGCRGPLPWGSNVHNIPADEVHHLPLDCVIYQRRSHYFEDRFEILSDEQRRLPAIYIEHDPPQEHPTFQLHPIQDPDVL